MGVKVYAQIGNIFSASIPISQIEELAKHPTIQVGQLHLDKRPEVRFIGLLNGMFGVDKDGWGCIAMICDDKTKRLIGFSVLEDRHQDSIQKKENEYEKIVLNLIDEWHHEHLISNRYMHQLKLKVYKMRNPNGLRETK